VKAVNLPWRRIAYWVLGIVLWASSAMGQSGLVVCTGTAAPAAVSAQGLDELVGDVILTCFPTIGGPSSPTITTNLGLSLNVGVTNDVDFGAGADIADAVAVVNENHCSSPASSGGVHGGCGAPDERVQDPQFARLATSNRLEWNNIEFPFPGASASPAPGFYPSVTTIRFTGVRANVSQLGVAPFVTGLVSIFGGTTIPITNNTLNVAVPTTVPVGAASPPDPLQLGATTCSATAVSPTVSAQGLAEIVGDVVLICSNPTAAAPDQSTVVVDLSLALNVDVANDLDFGSGADVSDAILIINGNICDSPSASGGTFGGCGAPDARFQDPQYGRRVTPNRLDWENVHFPVPTSECAGSGCFPTTTVVRITGIRAHAAQLGAPSEPTVPSTQINATLTTSGIPVVRNVWGVGVPLDGPVSHPDPPDPSQTGVVVCQATAVPPVIRAEGIAELVGDIVLICQPSSGEFPDSEIVVDIGVSLTVNVTNRVGFNADGVADAVLVVNEHNCTTPSATGASYACGAGTFQDPQFGHLVGANRLEWDNVVFPVPAVSSNPTVTTVRITSMRANAAQLGVPETPTFPTVLVDAYVSVSGPTTVSISTNKLVVGVPILALIIADRESRGVGSASPPPTLIRRPFWAGA